MRRRVIPLLFTLVLLASSCVERLYATRENVPSMLQTHRTVAVLPFYVRVERPWLSEVSFDDLGMSEAEFDRRQAAEIRGLAYGLQGELATRLQQQSWRVQFQEVAETNKRLSQAGISLDSLGYRSTEELQQVLGVDAVLAGETRVVQSLPGPLAMLMLFAPTDPSEAPLNVVRSYLSVYDGRTGQLAWRFEHEQTGNVVVNAKSLGKELAKRAYTALPYRAQ
ncbi:hypothetical protein [Solirubrum puertoriconensis]|uniref:Lipoprotein n=1 Tax=Solirubrum puertoriconensis TaxID=1751427 RepID=A0A9X0HLK1_SOLP1|nr:hypothetical protein [Solirubrum puertoriconensis]KUG08156.1 hypothetical protein ASU33_08155 [Solirubrum puertoriconensis]